jgi:hypothetical protein
MNIKDWTAHVTDPSHRALAIAATRRVGRRHSATGPGDEEIATMNPVVLVPSHRHGRRASRTLRPGAAHEIPAIPASRRCTSDRGGIMRRVLALSALALLLLAGCSHVGGGVSPNCPQGLVPLNVPAGWPQSTWTACGDRIGKTMFLQNISDESLLVTSQSPFAQMEVISPGSGDEPDQLAEEALAEAVRGALDPQAEDFSFDSVYLGPHDAVRVTSLLPHDTSVKVHKDYYATAKWTLAHAAASWALSKATSRLKSWQTLRDSVLSCASDLQVSAQDVSNPPVVGEVVHSTILTGSDCGGLMRTFAPAENGDRVAAEVRGFTLEIAKNVPSGTWEDILDGVMQLLHER